MIVNSKKWQALKPWLLGCGLVFSLCIACFVHGFVVSQSKLFPYGVLRDARAALSALVGLREPAEVNGLAAYRLLATEPTVVRHAGQSPGGLLLMCAGGNSFQSVYPEGALAWIMNRAGEVVHVWKNVPGLWDDLKQVTRVPGISGAINPVGLHLFDNGNLLATYHGYNTFPFAIGMACVDKDSNLLWLRSPVWLPIAIAISPSGTFPIGGTALWIAGQPPQPPSSVLIKTES